MDDAHRGRQAPGLLPENVARTDLTVTSQTRISCMSDSNHSGRTSVWSEWSNHRASDRSGHDAVAKRREETNAKNLSNKFEYIPLFSDPVILGGVAQYVHSKDFSNIRLY